MEPRKALIQSRLPTFFEKRARRAHWMHRGVKSQCAARRKHALREAASPVSTALQCHARPPQVTAECLRVIQKQCYWPR